MRGGDRYIWIFMKINEFKTQLWGSEAGILKQDYKDQFERYIEGLRQGLIDIIAHFSRTDNCWLLIFDLGNFH